MGRGGVAGSGPRACVQSTEYRYLRMRQQYVCLDGNPLVPLLSANGRLLRHLGLRNLLDLTLHHLHLPHPFAWSNVMRLPVYGQFSFPVQRGYLVFDLERRVVTKIFRPMLPAVDFRAWARAIEDVRGISFAPDIGEISADGQWAEMDYVDGSAGFSLIAHRMPELMATYERHVLPCLREMMRLKPWRRLSAREYVDGLRDGMNMRVLNAFPEVREAIERHFAQLDAACVAPNAAVEIALTFSHGDFVHPNFMVAGSELHVVDWDSAGWRSALHDLHGFFFSQMYWRPSFMVARGAVRRAADSLLADYPADRAPMLARLDLYRALYYMERVAMVLLRDFSTAEAQHLLDAVKLHTAFDRQ